MKVDPLKGYLFILTISRLLMYVNKPSIGFKQYHFHSELFDLLHQFPLIFHAIPNSLNDIQKIEFDIS